MEKSFCELILKKLQYDIIKYDAGDVRNKSIIENITKHNMADTNVLSLFQKNKKNCYYYGRNRWNE